MSSVDEEVQEPFKLCIDTIQGRWMCEELGAALTVVGQTVQYASGECYPIDVTSEGKLEIFGYRGIEKKSDASSILWKHRETGKTLTWMYEGDQDDAEPEVDASLIIQGSTGRTSRKRKVDYVALDKVLDHQPNASLSKQAVWEAQYSGMQQAASSSSQGPAQPQVEAEFRKLKDRFFKWLLTTDTDRCRAILSKRGYLSFELDYVKSSAGTEAATRIMAYIKSTGAKAMSSQTGAAINIRVPESVWKGLLTEASAAHANQPAPLVDEAVVEQVEKIRDVVIAYCAAEEHTAEETDALNTALSLLDSLPVDLEILKRTKVGVEINKLAKTIDRAKQSLTKLKAVYLESRKE